MALRLETPYQGPTRRPWERAAGRARRLAQRLGRCADNGDLILIGGFREGMRFLISKIFQPDEANEQGVVRWRLRRRAVGQAGYRGQ
ncbi:MAG: hypothetical protein WAV07_04610 [Candidatus Contendobacter sp.]